jgi:hypothetical protein
LRVFENRVLKEVIGLVAIADGKVVNNATV